MKAKILTIIIGCLALFSSCEKDGEFIKILGLEKSELVASETTVVIAKEKFSSSVLALSWNASELSISDTSKGFSSSMPLVVIEVSATNTFDSIISITPTGNNYTFTGLVLCKLAKDLGFVPFVSTPMYFRIKKALGKNTDPKYSEAVIVNVTSCPIDMEFGSIWSSSKEDTGFKLYSPNANGEYFGFVGASGWSNWYLSEGDGSLWGNVNIDGHPFEASNDQNAQWNFWYPGISGCYYTTLSTTKNEWTATLIPSLTVSGDVDATMTFDKVNVKWYVSLKTAADNAKVKVSSTEAKLYNKTTKTDDAAALTKSIGFIPQADSTLTIDWNETSAGDITIAKAGEYTLTFYLSDPKTWKFEIKSGATVVAKPLSKKLFLMGIDDNIVPGGWNFNRYLQLISSDDSTYGGVVYVDSKWGFNMSLDSNEWTNVYKKGATEGTFLYKSVGDITAPAAGLYIMQVDLKKLTYTFTAVNDLGYAGFNDNWTLVDMNTTTVSGVYTSNVTITGATPWGIKFVMNKDWDNLFFGGSNGTLVFKGSNINDYNSFALGTYDIVVNIRENTQVVFGDKVFIGGLHDVWDFTSVVLNKTDIGVYKGTATINSKSPWGIKIYLQDGNWDRFFGGSFSSLKYKGANITDDQDLANGTYTVTVDFINNTCSFVAQ